MNDKELNDNIKRMREVSGEIKSKDKLVCFLYELLRDVVVSGDIEKIMMNIKTEEIEYQFTNGWLAQYAKDIASRLK